MPLTIDGNIQVYPGVVVTHEDPVHFAPDAIIMSAMTIGAFTYFGERTILGTATAIGRFCSIAPGVVIGLGAHPTDYVGTSPVFFRAAGHFVPAEPLPDIGVARTPDVVAHGPVIGHDVWIGANAVIARGVTIGTGAVIGAGAFVNRDVRPYAIVGGLPAREIRRRFDDAIVDRLLATEWWDHDLDLFEGIDVSDVPGQIDAIERRVAARTKRVYATWEARGE